MSRTAMSRVPAPAFSVPRPTVTTGTCWSRRRRAATSGLTPLFEAKSERITIRAIRLLFWASRFSASSMAVPSSVSRPSGSGAAFSSSLGSLRVASNRYDLDLEVRAERLGGLERLLEGLPRHGPPGLAADLVAEDHAGAGVDQEDERRGLPLLLLEDDRRPQRRQQAEQEGQQPQAQGHPAPARRWSRGASARRPRASGHSTASARADQEPARGRSG